MRLLTGTIFAPLSCFRPILFAICALFALPGKHTLTMAEAETYPQTSKPKTERHTIAEEKSRSQTTPPSEWRIPTKTQNQGYRQARPTHTSQISSEGQGHQPARPTHTSQTLPKTQKQDGLRTKKQATSAETQGQSASSYSFRPLLIRGKKRMVQKAENIKTQAENIVESELFFIEPDFKKRIFEDGGLE